MTLHKVEGCTAFSLNVDGKEEIDMTNEERLEVIDKIHKWMRNNLDKFNFVLQGLADYCGEYNVICDTPCETCGDIVDEKVLEF